MNPVRSQTLHFPAEENDRTFMCRLRALNPDTLTSVCKYLKVDDIKVLSQMNEDFKDVLYQNLMHKRTIISDGYIDPEIFQLFGRRITKLKFKGDQQDFYDLLEKVLENCSGDQFKVLEFDLFCWENDDSLRESILELINQARQYFQNVESVTIIGEDTFNDPDEGADILSIMQKLFDRSKKLRKLKLESINSGTHHLLHWNRLQFIDELHLDHVDGINDEEFNTYLQRSPKLKHFYCFPPKELNEIGDTFIESTKDNLRALHGLHEDNQCDFIEKFKNIKEITVYSFEESGDDLDYPISILTKQDAIEKLCIRQHINTDHNSTATMSESSEEEKVPPSIGYLTKLKTIEITCTSCSCSKCGPKEREPLEFLVRYAKKLLINVDTIILNNHTPYLSNLIQHTPNLKVLVIWSSDILESNQMIADIKTIIEQRDIEDFVEIVVNRNQFAAFKSIEGSEKWFKLTARQHDKILTKYQ